MKIEELHEKWVEDIKFQSSVSAIVESYYYQRIIERGKDALEYILKDLAENMEEPDYWFPALKEITDADPVHKSSYGKVSEMAKDWVIWGLKNDIIEPEDL